MHEGRCAVAQSILIIDNVPEFDPIAHPRITTIHNANTECALYSAAYVDNYIFDGQLQDGQHRVCVLLTADRKVDSHT